MLHFAGQELTIQLIMSSFSLIEVNTRSNPPGIIRLE